MISIVAPVYNGSAYLDQCIGSILSQTFEDWECILVDDGSTDSSGEICDNWTNKDQRIIVIHQQNAGVSAARNSGVEKAKGEWITFVDSDDWLEPNYLSSMASQTVGADLVVSGQIREYEDGSTKIFKPNGSKQISIDSEDAEAFNELNVRFLLYAPHEKLFRAEIIKNNNLTFPVGCSYGEDLQFVYSYLEHVKTIVSVDRAIYHYRMANGGTLSTAFRENQFSEDYHQWQIVYNFYDRHGLLNESARLYLAERLWGIVYDGIFHHSHLLNKSNYFKVVLSIPEIVFLEKYQDVFETARWIKWLILKRKSGIFSFYFRYLKRDNDKAKK